MSSENEKYIKIEVAGEDEALWAKTRKKLVETILGCLDSLLEIEIDPIKGSTIREEAQKFSSALLDYGKSKLNKPGIDNDRTLAEIEELYSRRQKNVAEARKINAEAYEIELNTRIKKFKFILEIAKVIPLGMSGDESFLFLKDIEQLKMILDAWNNDTSSADL